MDDGFLEFLGFIFIVFFSIITALRAIIKKKVEEKIEGKTREKPLEQAKQQSGQTILDKIHNKSMESILSELNTFSKNDEIEQETYSNQTNVVTLSDESGTIYSEEGGFKTAKNYKPKPPLISEHACEEKYNETRLAQKKEVKTRKTLIPEDGSIDDNKRRTKTYVSIKNTDSLAIQPQKTDSPIISLTLTKQKLLEGIVWKEVLARPLGLRDE